MREVSISERDLPRASATFLACLATILELEPDDLPQLAPEEDPATGGTVSRWLAGLGLGLVRVADVGTFSWSGPWIARLRPPPPAGRRSIVMYGIPSGVVWDPAAGGGHEGFDQGWIEDGFVVAATDVAGALPGRPGLPAVAGTVETISVAGTAGETVRLVDEASAIAGRGLGGDRHTVGTGTFPSGVPGSALTIIAAEVCEAFDPPLRPDEHRRNVVTRGIDLNPLVGYEFTIGEVLCRGMRLCEPCRVVQSYASRPVLRALVHRGGLRADILTGGSIRVGDELRAVAARRTPLPPAAGARRIEAAPARVR